VSTAPKELREVDMNSKLSKSKKKQKNRTIRNQALMEEAMEHIAQKEKEKLEGGPAGTSKEVINSMSAMAETSPPEVSEVNDQEDAQEDPSALIKSDDTMGKSEEGEEPVNCQNESKRGKDGEEGENAEDERNSNVDSGDEETKVNGELKY